jgi:hypothetical protein
MQNGRWKRNLNAAAMALGAFVLVRSFALQLFWPLESIDRPDPHDHRAFCTAHLLLLRTELQEATWQDMARGLEAPKGFCAKSERRAQWQRRLGRVRARCADSAAHGPLGARLEALEAQTCELFGQAAALWSGEGKALKVDLDDVRE